MIFNCQTREIDCKKQKCWVHLLREIRELKNKNPEDLEIKSGV